MTYVPKVDDEVRVVILGRVTQYDPVTTATKVGNAQRGAITFKPTDAIVTELEHIPPPEKWHDDDVVLDARGRTFRRTERGTWQTFRGEDVRDNVPVRPLALLVRDGQLQ